MIATCPTPIVQLILPLHLLLLGLEGAVLSVIKRDQTLWHLIYAATFKALWQERARLRVVALQGGDEKTLEAWRYLVDESISYFSEVYQRLGVLLTESDNCAESFYNPH